MSVKRDVIRATHQMIVSRVFDPTMHADPARRGGYLKLLPGRLPEIVLDGLATDAQQRDAEGRCMRELEAAQFSRSSLDDEEDAQRRELVRLTQHYVVTREVDPIHHEDPRLRGGHLVLRKNRLPEIVLDDLCSQDEQQKAEARCLRVLGQVQSAQGVLQKLQDTLLAGDHEIMAGTHAGHAASRAGNPRGQRGGQQIGQRLLDRGLITQAALDAALSRQLQLPETARIRRVGSLLIEAGALGCAPLAKLLGEQRGIRAAHTTSTRVDAALRTMFPLDLLVRLQVAPLLLVGRSVAMAMADPLAADAIGALQARTSCAILPVQAPQWQVVKLLESIERSAAFRRPPSRVR